MSETSPKLRAEMEGIPTYKPGKPAAAGGPVAYKLSSNENPYPPLPGVLETVTAAACNFNRYPDMACSGLMNELSERFGVPLSHLATGTGSVGVAQQLIQATSGPGDEVIYAWRSFEAYPMVGYRINEEKGRAELTDFWLVLTQNTTLNQVFHSFSAAFLTGGAFMVGIAAFHLLRKKHIPVMRTSLRLGLVTVAVGGLLTAVSGDTLGKVMYEQQPMKMAAAEALWDGEKPAPFSVFAYGDVDKGHNKVALEIPGLLSFLAHSDFESYVPGINDTNKALQEKFGPGDYKPIVPVAYWGFRWMIGFGMASLAIGLLGLWLTRKKFLLPAAWRTGEDEVPHLVLFRKPLRPRLTRLYWLVAVWTMAFPLIANSWGWIFTEMGRQPWVVYGLFQTRDAVSPGVSQAEVITSLIVFTTLYAILAVIEVKLLVKYVKAGPPELTEADLNPPTKIGGDSRDADKPMAFSY
ncbi:Putative phenylalanine aminotransferase [Streptomyces violarus]